MTPVLSMLCLGTAFFLGFIDFTFATYRLRQFTFVSGSPKTWEEASEECKSKNGTLVTLYDREDQTFLKTVGYPFPWVGLRRSRVNVSTWSDGVDYTLKASNVTATIMEQKCESIENQAWKSYNCSEKKAFMCYRDNSYILVETVRMNWCQARQYCRKHFKDLVSIRDEVQNLQVIKKGGNKIFWIGLMHDEWEWMDKTCSTYRSWTINAAKDCALLSSSGSLQPTGCDGAQSVICSKGDVRIIVVRDNLTWEQALDYCVANHTGLLMINDKNDQYAVEQWLEKNNAMGPFWIGLRQSRVFGFWIWSDRLVSYSNWKDKQQPEMSAVNNCGVINKTDTKWSDENCSKRLPFICEEDI